MKLFSLLAVATLLFSCSPKIKATKTDIANSSIKTGAEQTELYLPLLKGKRVAVLANQTSIIGKTHLVDSLQKLGVKIVKVFGPEHGFRGNASAGAKIADAIDERTGIPIISLYGKRTSQVMKIYKM